MGRLFQRIEFADAIRGVQYMRDNLRADVYNYAHLIYLEDVKKLREDKPLTLSFFVIGPRPEYDTTWEHWILNKIWRDCDQFDLWLRFDDLSIATFKWNGHPRMIHWGIVPDPVLYEWIRLLRTFAGLHDVRYWLDLCFLGVADWMFENTQKRIEHLIDYSQVRYQQQLSYFVKQLQLSDHLAFVNGSWGWASQYSTMFENMDRPEKDMWWAVTHTYAYPKHVMSLEGPPQDRTIEVVRFWRDSDTMMLELKNPAMNSIVRSRYWSP